MNDIEDRLRTALHDLADGLPASQHARADLDRRLARGTGRGRVLAIAAAAAVVAAVTVPVVLSQDGDPANGRAATSAPPLTSASPLSEYISQPLGSFTDENGVRTSAMLSVGFRGAGENWCVSAAVGEVDVSNVPCEPMPTWPTEHNSLVLSRGVLSGGVLFSGPLPNLLLFVTAPQVAELEVREAHGQPVPVRRLVMTTGATFFLAEFPESYSGFGYTAKDADGNVVEQAIT
jgi:hypothetical protein